jgi:hypothetical protein
MTDWADEEAEKLHELVIRQYRWDDSLKLSGKIAAALRSAERRGMVAGLRKMAFELLNDTCSSQQAFGINAASFRLYRAADRIEKGE